ncbi:hypothetical protein [Kitasatospora paranensis]|jgi:hypothetical protein|uniref:TfoX N-terminal domain-containing protein n=1 Tax=Kitasatospora paranensis TaxID=258053 RepID=A0ABW2FY07_9ACTN
MTDDSDPGFRYAEIAEELTARGVSRATMFGMPCLKDAAGKAFAGLHQGELVCRLGRDSPALAEALRLPGAHLFDPVGGRPMQDWACIPPGAAAHWDNYAEAALIARR